MKYKLLIFCLLVACQLSVHANTVWTRYEDGVFVSFVSVHVKCPMSVADAVVDDLIDQFRGDPQLLFEWAFKDLGKQSHDDSKNEVLIELKEVNFDKMTGISRLLTDIVVPGFTTYKDIAIESKVVKEKLDKGITRVSVDIFYSNALLKKAYGTFFVVPISADSVMMSVKIHVRFGWFFNMFITKNRYRNLVEWRQQGFMNNMRDESERRALKGMRK